MPGKPKPVKTVILPRPKNAPLVSKCCGGILGTHTKKCKKVRNN